MNVYEHELFTKLYDAWRPKNGIGMHSVKTEPLSDECKTAIARLAGERGLTVEFPVEPSFEDLTKQQHYVRALRKNKKAP